MSNTDNMLTIKMDGPTDEPVQARGAGDTDPLVVALAKAQGEMRGAEKDSTNPHLKNRYASLAAVIEAIRLPLSRNGLAYTQLPLLRGDMLVLQTRLMHTSGASLTCEWPLGPATQSPQNLGSANTYARRYSLMACIGIASEEDPGASDDDDDGHAASRGHQRQRGPGKGKREPAPATKSANPAPAAERTQGPPHPDGVRLAFTQAKTLEAYRAAAAMAKALPDGQRQQLRDVWQAAMQRLDPEGYARLVANRKQPEAPKPADEAHLTSLRQGLTMVDTEADWLRIKNAISKLPPEQRKALQTEYVEAAERIEQLTDSQDAEWASQA